MHTSGRGIKKIVVGCRWRLLALQYRTLLLPLLFQPQYRYTGVATGWNLGVIIAGGTAPYVAVKLVQMTENKQSPAYFVIVAAIIGLVGVLSIRRDVARSVT